MLRINKGFSLIELMVAMVVGLFVAAIVATMYASIIRANSITIQAARLNMDMQAALDIIARDIQRAGYVSGAEAALERDSSGNPTSSAASSSFHTAMFSAVNNTGDPLDLNADDLDCVLLRYDANNNSIIASTSNAPELIGYRYNPDPDVFTVEYRSWTTVPQSCTDSGWSTFAGGDGHIDITNLEFILSPVSGANASSGAYNTTGQRAVEIRMEGRSASNNQIQLELRRVVRLSNDKF